MFEKEVMNRWLKAALAAMLSIALFGAPCRNCQPQTQQKAHCGHDCCPKPKPVQSCTWQPSDTAATDAKAQVEVAAPEMPVLAMAVEAALPDVQTVRFEPCFDSSPPPLYLAHSSFLI